MKKVILTLFVAFVAAISVLSITSADTMGSSASSDTATVTVITPDNVKWMPAEGMPGIQIAVMYGDPKKTGSAYTMRLKIPDGYKGPVHTHPDMERVTVLSGTVMFSSGHTMDPSKATTLGPGSFVVIPANVHHWISTKGETILQTSGVGPFTMNIVH